MKDNLKTAGFLILIALLCLVPSLHKEINRGKRKVLEESENARELYTGKTRAVYDPIDTAYVVSDKLKELVQKENTLDVSHFKEWPVVSVWIDPNDLYSEERGIFKNPTKKGRLWERASFLSYYEHGNKLFSSFAGVRVHGGVHRNDARKSLRFHFRKSIGEDSFLTDLDIGQTPAAPIKRLLLRRDTVHHFANDFGFSLVREMGGMAPKIKHVAVYLNGEFYQYMQMTEQLHEDQAKYAYNHDRFIYYKLKSSNSSRDRLLFENAIHRVKGASKPISFEEMNKLFDLDNITANMLAIMYLNITDWAQGVWIKDLTIQEPKWQIISWDFDFAFIKGNKKFQGPPWEVDGVEIGLKHHNATLRSHLFNRLLKESPEFREYFVKKVDHLFENVLTDKFLDEKFGSYQILAQDSPDSSKLSESILAMKEFLKNRKSFFCQHLEAATKIKPESCSK